MTDGRPPRRAELLVRGRIATLSGETGFGWVEALAVGEGRILAAGRGEEVEVLADHRTRRLSLDRRHAVIPAITDAHLHLRGASIASLELDLEPVASLDDALAVIADAHRTRSDRGDRNGWLLGRGWSRDRWGRAPTAMDLERAAPGRPVALWSHDFHSHWVSRGALAAASITAATPDPPGGVIARDADGQPTGFLVERPAVELVEKAMPPVAEADRLRWLRDIQPVFHAAGITSVVDPRPVHSVKLAWAIPSISTRKLKARNGSSRCPV